jgi:ribonuclease inhibitor
VQSHEPRQSLPWLISNVRQKKMSAASTVEVDISGLTKKSALHEHLAAVFGFPDYYGKNWDAFWDCVTTLDPMPGKIRIIGMKSLARVLPDEATHLKKCFDDFRAEPDLKSVAVDLE